MYCSVQGDLGKADEPQLRQWMKFANGDPERAREMLAEKRWGSIWLDDPRVVYDLLRCATRWRTTPICAGRSEVSTSGRSWAGRGGGRSATGSVAAGLGRSSPRRGSILR